MADWNKNNAACLTTWGTLRALEQTRRVFSEAGEVKMQELAWWNPTTTADLRRAAAQAMARQLDNIFLFVRGARYEPGVASDQAVAAMVDTLTVPDRTVADLAAVNDANYHFLSEP